MLMFLNFPIVLINLKKNLTYLLRQASFLDNGKIQNYQHLISYEN